MSKIMKLSNGREIDLDILYPIKDRLPKNHADEYDPADDIYGEITNEDREKYGLRKV